MNNLLLLSNSTNAGEPYLSYAKDVVADFIAENTNVIFIPYAGVGFSYDAYVEKVNEGLKEIGKSVIGIHSCADEALAIREADVIVVGGGNTFQLLKILQDKNLLGIIKERVNSGAKYIGWSAGSNLTCPSIRTTNDMPIVEPESFNALNLIPFQINPHYLDAYPNGHAGETREQRITEFLALNKMICVLGLREGTYLKSVGDELLYFGQNKTCRVFNYSKAPYEIEAGVNVLTL